MKILYGVSGDGFGHSSRAGVVGGYLSRWGHDVKMVTYGKAYDVLKDHFDVFKVSGMEIQFIKGELQKRQTLKHNLKVISENLSDWKRFRDLMKDFDPDLCISDMEPIVPILRYWFKKPLICLDNQHRITNLKLDIPTRYYPDFVMAKTVVENFVSKADHFIVTSFTDAPVKTPDTTIVPPVIRKEVKETSPVEGDKILVYLTRENPDIIDILKQFEDRFVVFGYNVSRTDSNLEFRERPHFLDELKACRAIIATAGFTLMSEALYLKKPYLALPLKGQFEQVLNALFLKQAGFGDYADHLTRQDVADFLVNMPKFKKALSGYELNFEKLPETLKQVVDRVANQ
jgi:uncharacterized protein (TIGR00661 family)